MCSPSPQNSIPLPQLQQIHRVNFVSAHLYTEPGQEPTHFCHVHISLSKPAALHERIRGQALKMLSPYSQECRDGFQYAEHGDVI